MDNSSERILYRRAQKRVREIKSFYIHLLCYCIVIPILIFLNLQYSREELWFFYPMLGWGTGLTIHGMGAFRYNPFVGRQWEERKIKELMEKERQSRDRINNQ